jgi:hypothetical protein
MKALSLKYPTVVKERRRLYDILAKKAGFFPGFFILAQSV